MGREHMDYPRDIQVETPFGPVFMTVVQGDYVYVDASSRSKTIAYRGNEYVLSLRLHTYDGGKTWELLRGPGGGVDSCAIYGHKYGDCRANIPPSYLKKIVAGIIEKVAEHLSTHKHLLRQAAMAHAHNNWAREADKLDEMEAQVAAQGEKVEALRAKYDEARVDIRVANEGTLYLFEIVSDVGREWVEKNVDLEPYQWLGENRFAVEHSYAPPLVDAMAANGLEVQ